MYNPQLAMGANQGIPLVYNYQPAGYQNPGYHTGIQQPGVFRGGRGRGVMPAQGYPIPTGYMSYHISPYGRGAFRRKRKPFHGGTLESQRDWEKSHVCCFHLQAQCKFADHCRFSHDIDSGLPCQFGDQCKVGHNKSKDALPDTMHQQALQLPQQ
eukprot:Tbor_TRINITY_DN4236_c0_g2::TRINITY_DN4236_c0_g2_i1::g.24060::m.24060